MSWNPDEERKNPALQAARKGTGQQVERAHRASRSGRAEKQMLLAADGQFQETCGTWNADTVNAVMITSSRGMRNEE